MARGKAAQIRKIKKLLEHTQVKQLPKWENAYGAHRQIQKMTDKQFQVYSAVIDHHRKRANIKDFYPLADEKHIDDLKGEDSAAVDSLARNLGSKNQLARWHRKTWSNAMEKKGSGWASAAGSAVKKTAKYLAEKGVSLAKAAWATTKKVVSSLGKLGNKALKWALDPNNQKKIANLIELVKQGIGVAQLIGGLGDSGPIPAKELETVSVEKKASVDAIMDDDDDDSSGDDSEDDGLTVGEM